MRVLITCGPSYEPVDQVRRLTNFSTGRLGMTLAHHLARAGHDVLCLRGEQATYAGSLEGVRHEGFSTNADLGARLEAWAGVETFDAVLHSAALSDFRVSRVTTCEGTAVSGAKIDSRQGDLLLRLEPAPKILPRLRDWFPMARIVGWKYELAGTPAEAVERAGRQIDACRSDGCVLNGSAYGPGFGFCRKGREIEHWAGLDELCAGMQRWLEC